MRTISVGLVAMAVTAAGCGGAHPSTPTRELAPVVDPAPWPPAVPPPGTNAALAPVAWLLGDWRAVHGETTEHWTAAGGTLYGVQIGGGTYRVMVIDDGDDEAETADGVRRYITYGDGHASTEYREVTIERDHASFVAGGDRVDYALRDGELVIGQGDGDKFVELEFRRATADPAAALEQTDLAFAADTLARGADGWIAWFAPEGALWRGERIEGRTAIAGKMTGMLSRGVLAWQPIASRADGDLGFTVGTATFTATGATEPGWRGSYVTVWQSQPDATWKAVLDLGRGEQPAR